MRIVFIGRQSFANHCFAGWLAKRHQVVAYFRADMRRYTLGHRLAWVRKRVSRSGMLRTVDQLLYRSYYRMFEHRENERLLRQAFGAAFGQDALELPAEIPLYEFEDLNSDEALATLKALEPDLAFAVCISQYLRKPYQQVPRLGTVLYHEGLTPEYKGLHTAFWANARGESARIGYTLLQLNAEIDGGKPLAQGLGRIDPELARWWAYAGHQALIDGLPDVERALASLESGEPIKIAREQGAPETFSYAGLSDEIRRRWRPRPSAPPRG